VGASRLRVNRSLLGPELRIYQMILRLLNFHIISRDRKQRTDIRKYTFVNRTIKNWNQLPAEALGTFPRKPKIFRNRVRKATINGVKRKE